MSGRLMKQFMGIKGLWASPAQAGTMGFLCWEHREDLGYAEASAGDIADRLGVGRRYVFTVFEQLETGLEAITRLEPGDRGRAHDGTKQKIAITLDRALAKAVATVEAADAAQTGGVMIQGSSPWWPLDHQGADPQIRGVMIPVPAGDDPGIITGSHQDLRSKYQEYKAAAARLPLLDTLKTDNPPAIEAAIRQARARRLTTLRERYRREVRGLLLNPALAAALLTGESIDGSIGALWDAAKRVCAKKRIPYSEREQLAALHGICVSEHFKFRNPDVIAGRAPRPRDLARRPRS